MSVRMLDLVWERSKAKGAARSVLLAIANFARAETDDSANKGEAWPAIRRLVGMTQLTRQGVQKALAKLVQLGELAIDECEGPKTRYGSTNLYRINWEVLEGHQPNWATTSATKGGQLSCPRSTETEGANGIGGPTGLPQGANPVTKGPTGLPQGANPVTIRGQRGWPKPLIGTVTGKKNKTTTTTAPCGAPPPSADRSSCSAPRSTGVDHTARGSEQDSPSSPVNKGAKGTTSHAAPPVPAPELSDEDKFIRALPQLWAKSGNGAGLSSKEIKHARQLLRDNDVGSNGHLDHLEIARLLTFCRYAWLYIAKDKVEGSAPSFDEHLFKTKNGISLKRFFGKLGEVESWYRDEMKDDGRRGGFDLESTRRIIEVIARAWGDEGLLEEFDVKTPDNESDVLKLLIEEEQYLEANPETA